MHIQRLLVTLVGVVEDVGLHQIFFYAAVLDLKERRAGTQDPPPQVQAASSSNFFSERLYFENY